MIRDPRDVLLSQKGKWKRRTLGAKNIPRKEYFVLGLITIPSSSVNSGMLLFDLLRTLLRIKGSILCALNISWRIRKKLFKYL
jgi:hypothetical protein